MSFEVPISDEGTRNAWIVNCRIIYGSGRGWLVGKNLEEGLYQSRSLKFA